MLIIKTELLLVKKEWKEFTKEGRTNHYLKLTFVDTDYNKICAYRNADEVIEYETNCSYVCILEFKEGVLKITDVSTERI